jgi:hypothetical protein
MTSLMQTPESQAWSLEFACSSVEQLVSVHDQYDDLFWEVYTFKYNLPEALLFQGLDLRIEFQHFGGSVTEFEIMPLPQNFENFWPGNLEGPHEPNDVAKTQKLYITI